MVRYDDDAIWIWEPTGELDDDGEEMGDYVLSGSVPLTQWELTVYGLQSVELSTDLLQGVY